MYGLEEYRLPTKTRGGISGPGIEGTVTYNPDTKTLTLNGATINGARIVTEGSTNRHYNIYADDSLNIELIGSNNLTSVVGGLNNNNYGIYTQKKSDYIRQRQPKY